MRDAGCEELKKLRCELMSLCCVVAATLYGLRLKVAR